MGRKITPKIPVQKLGSTSTDDLVANTIYSVQMASGALIDTTGHTYAGISNEAAFNFTTVSPPVIATKGVEESPFMVF